MQDSVTDAVNTVACITDDYSRDCHYRGGKYHPFSCVFSATNLVSCDLCGKTAIVEKS